MRAECVIDEEVSLDWDGEDEKIVGEEEGIKSTISSGVREDPNGTCLPRAVLT